MNAVVKNAFWVLAAVSVLTALTQFFRQLGAHEEISWPMPIFFFCCGFGLGGLGWYFDYLSHDDDASHSDDSDYSHDQSDDIQGGAVSSDD